MHPKWEFSKDFSTKSISEVGTPKKSEGILCRGVHWFICDVKLCCSLKDINVLQMTKFTLLMTTNAEILILV